MGKIVYLVLCLAAFSIVSCATVQKEQAAAALPLLNDNSGKCRLVSNGTEVGFSKLNDMGADYLILKLQQVVKHKAVEVGASHIKFDKEECKITTVGSENGRQCSLTWEAYKCK